MNLITLEIAIDSLEFHIEKCKEGKKKMSGIVEGSSDYWDTRIQDLKMAQDELAIEVLIKKTL
tara:strand:+ start:1294 stop:1482 length:189 start_codon:yes stop_codon:yes gene_type:complete